MWREFHCSQQPQSVTTSAGSGIQIWTSHELEFMLSVTKLGTFWEISLFNQISWSQCSCPKLCFKWSSCGSMFTAWTPSKIIRSNVRPQHSTQETTILDSTSYYVLYLHTGRKSMQTQNMQIPQRRKIQTQDLYRPQWIKWRCSLTADVKAWPIQTYLRYTSLFALNNHTFSIFIPNVATALCLCYRTVFLNSCGIKGCGKAFRAQRGHHGISPLTQTRVL